MFACLLIDNCDECSIQIGELLAFYSSKWELGDGGVIYTDFDSIGDRIQVLIYELKLREMQARIGVAPSRFASFVAAHAVDVETPLFISPVQLEAFLADQSVSYLPISGKNQERLGMLGLRTLGQVARIDVRELVNQFGREGQFMSELARGIDSTPLPSQRPPADADEGMWQMGIWDSREGTETHRQPAPTTIVSDDAGYPQSLLINGMEVFITDIVDLWTIENRWWTDSHYSFLNGTSSPAELVEQAVKLGLKGLALTDDNGLYSVIPFVRKCEELGLPYCVGASITVGQDNTELEPQTGQHNDDYIILLCQNLTGYHNLSQLITRARHARPKGEARATLDAINELSEGLICLVGGKEGNIPKLILDNQIGRASAAIEIYREIFSDNRLYVELVNHREPGDFARCRKLYQLASELGLECVPTNGVRYASQDKATLYDVLRSRYCTQSDAG